jgi:hypothetical protein
MRDGMENRTQRHAQCCVRSVRVVLEAFMRERVQEREREGNKNRRKNKNENDNDSRKSAKKKKFLTKTNTIEQYNRGAHER